MALPKKTTGRINVATIDWIDQYSPCGIITTDENLIVTGWNQWMVIHSGRDAGEVVGQKLLDLYPDLVERKMERYFRTALTGQTVILSNRFHGYLLPMAPTDRRMPLPHMPLSSSISPLLFQETVIGTISYMEDVSERIQRETELEEQITQLKEAMNQVKVLKGLLPICSFCKKIRDDEGYWNQLEVYIGNHADVDFSHGICPECLKKHYPEYEFEEEIPNGKNSNGG